MQSVPNEFLELYYPLIVERYESIEDSGGPGYYRGGNGLRIHYRFLAHGEVGLHDDRWLTKVSIYLACFPPQNLTIISPGG